MSEKSNKKKIAVIGGGASGLFAAISAAAEARRLCRDVDITVFEANQRVGKKLLVSGNGRCNLSNINMSADFYRGAPELFSAVYKKFDVHSVTQFFNTAGLLLRTDAAGRIYPVNNQASSVLDVLRREAERCGITENVGIKIERLEPVRGGLLLNSAVYADACIIACGGRAAPVHGCDGGGYPLLSRWGVKITPLYPALSPICLCDFTKALKGIRAESAIAIKRNGGVIAKSEGELQYTDYGVSGIPAMQISRFAAAALNENKADLFLFVDSAPFIEADALREFFLSNRKRDPDKSCELLLSGIVPKRLADVLLSKCSINPQKNIGGLHEAVFDKITAALKNAKYKISSVKGFADAQVTAGGVDAAEIDFETLRLKKAKGIYICGEIADIDGDCGGYNLQWAWSSGYTAGKSAVREL